MSTEPTPTVLAAPPIPEVDDHSTHRPAERGCLRLATAVMFVADLDRSVTFYRDRVDPQTTQTRRPGLHAELR